jgi:hypothetical protein
MITIKRAMILTPGVVALAACAFVTAAAGPGTSMPAGPSLNSHKSLTTLSTHGSASQARRGSDRVALEVSPALTTESPAVDTTTPAESAPLAAWTNARGQGNTFGQLISALAHSIPGGPDHGKLMSFFARSLNHGHTKAPKTHQR